MKHINEVIGFLIVLFALLFPLLRRFLERKSHLGDKKVEKETKRVELPVLKSRPATHLHPHTEDMKIFSTSPEKKKKDRLSLESLMKKKTESQKMVIYHEIFSQPKGDSCQWPRM